MAIAFLFLLLCGALMVMFMGLLDLLPPPPVNEADLHEFRRDSARCVDLPNLEHGRTAPLADEDTQTSQQPAHRAAGQVPQASPDQTALNIGGAGLFGAAIAASDTATGRIGAGAPVEFPDFDAQEEIVSVLLAGEASNPDLTADVDEATGTVTLYADGQPVAVLRGAAREFTMRNVAVLRYAA